MRRLGVAPERCIHTHPIKRDSDIRTALAYGVNRFVIDNPDELRKFVKFRTRASLLIRISFRSPDAQVRSCRANSAAIREAVADLLQLAAELRIKIDGLSFHVGSQAIRPGDVRRSHRGLPRADARRGAGRSCSPHILDIGGGFPVDYLQQSMPIEEFCAPIVAALKQLPPAVRVIAEPGRYIAAPAAICVASVMGRALRDGRWWYYLDDGLYGSYSGQVYDHALYPVEALLPGAATYPSVLAGPTCDSIDVISEKLELPKLDIGELIVGRMMGAYTWASASEFNFFPRATVLALDQGRLLTDGDRA